MKKFNVDEFEYNVFEIGDVVKVKAVDKDGFCGRDLHPNESHIGKAGVVCAVFAEDGIEGNCTRDPSFGTIKTMQTESVKMEKEWMKSEADEQIDFYFQLFFIVCFVEDNINNTFCLNMLDYELELVGR